MLAAGLRIGALDEIYGRGVWRRERWEGLEGGT